MNIICGDAVEVLRNMPSKSVNCCVTSPPYYGLRDYGTDGQIGLEETPEEHIERLVEIFREVRRVLRDDETLWLNIGDSCRRACVTAARSLTSAFSCCQSLRSITTTQRRSKNLQSDLITRLLQEAEGR